VRTLWRACRSGAGGGSRGSYVLHDGADILSETLPVSSGSLRDSFLTVPPPREKNVPKDGRNCFSAPNSP